MSENFSDDVFDKIRRRQQSLDEALLQVKRCLEDPSCTESSPPKKACLDDKENTDSLISSSTKSNFIGSPVKRYAPRPVYSPIKSSPNQDDKKLLEAKRDLAIVTSPLKSTSASSSSSPLKKVHFEKSASTTVKSNDVVPITSPLKRVPGSAAVATTKISVTTTPLSGNNASSSSVASRRAVFETPTQPRSEIVTDAMGSVADRAALFEKAMRVEAEKAQGNTPRRLPPPAKKIHSAAVTPIITPAPSPIPVATGQQAKPVHKDTPVLSKPVSKAVSNWKKQVASVLEEEATTPVASNTAATPKRLYPSANVVIEYNSPDLANLMRKGATSRSPQKMQHSEASASCAKPEVKSNEAVKRSQTTDASNDEFNPKKLREKFEQQHAMFNFKPAAQTPPPPLPPLPSKIPPAPLLPSSPSKKAVTSHNTPKIRVVYEDSEKEVPTYSAIDRKGRNVSPQKKCLSSIGEEDEDFSKKRKAPPPPVCSSTMTEEEANVLGEMDRYLDNCDDEASFDTISTISPKKSVRAAHYDEPSTSSSISVNSLSPPSISFRTPKYDPLTSTHKESPIVRTVSQFRMQQKQRRAQDSDDVIKVGPPKPPRQFELDSPVILPQDPASLERRLRHLTEESVNHKRIMIQASSALEVCHAKKEFYGSPEQIEAERLLLIATQRHIACRNEIQLLKKEGLPDMIGGGELSLDDIRLPLKREFLQALQNSQEDCGTHYFICLIRCGAQVLHTQLISTEEEITDGALLFTNRIALRDLGAKFKVFFEVYALQRPRFLPQDGRKHGGLSLRLHKKAKKDSARSTVKSPHNVPEQIRAPSFGLVGRVVLSVESTRRDRFIMEHVPYNSPLEGTALIKVHLYAPVAVEHEGMLTLFEEVGGFAALRNFYCVLRNNKLLAWNYPDEVETKAHVREWELSRCTTPLVRILPANVCPRRYTFRLVLKADPRIPEKPLPLIVLLTGADRNDAMSWCDALNTALRMIRRFDPEAVDQVPEPDLEACV